ncbi:MAG TPA: hypothetical protein VN256_24680 [Pyrinomonadaceae bacterium]|nr:hypothetical protein [Pyrinomonadaceae bacterium]
MSDDLNKVVELSGDERDSVVHKKAACPFIGSAVAQGQLPVRNSARDPLASIEDVRRLGNTGGGDLGDFLVLFARGNHALMRGDSGRLDKHLPGDLFSLDFPGSQGSHTGHSFILQDDPEVLDSGRLSEDNFARLTRRAKDGLITRSEVGRFIAENLIRDPKSKVTGINTTKLLIRDVGDLLETLGSVLLGKITGSHDDAALREVQEKFTRLAGENNLVGSAGEFGLLFAFLVNKPDAREVKNEPALAVEDLRAMFVDKRLPAGWETWKKSWKDWVENTAGLVKSAAKEYHALKKNQ